MIPINTYNKILIFIAVQLSDNHLAGNMGCGEPKMGKTFLSGVLAATA
jgi:hypothetical protein